MDPTHWPSPSSSSPPPFDEPPPQRRWPWAALAVTLCALILGGGWYLWRRAHAPAPPPAVAQAPQESDAGSVSSPAEGLPDAGYVRAEDQIQGLSLDPEYRKWAKQPNLTARAAAVVANVAAGDSPRALLGFLGPGTGFKVKEDASGTTVDPSSYDRYDATARVIGSMDAQAVARAYQLLKPSLQAAYSEISRPGQRFDAALFKALDRIAKVQVPEGEIKLVTKGAVYAFEAPELEALPAAEKHLLRMGPKNAKIVQAKCRELISALQLQTR